MAVQGACYGASAAVASGGASCSLRGWWVIVYLWADHLCNNWVIAAMLWPRKWPVKHDGNEHLSSIFLMRAGFRACICSRIATALFSHRFRSHSSTALCASDSVCGGTVRTAGVPSAERNALSGNVAAGTAVRAVTARWISLSSHHRREMFSL